MFREIVGIIEHHMRHLHEPQLVKKIAFMATCACTLTVIWLIGIILWIRRPFPEKRPVDVKEISTYDNVSLFGLILFCSFCGISIYLSCATTETFLQYTIAYCRKKIIYLSLGLYVCLSLVYLIIALIGTLTWAKLPLSCGVIFCIGDKYIPDYRDDKLFLRGFNGTLALMALFSLYPLSIVMLCRVFVLWLRLPTVLCADANNTAINRLDNSTHAVVVINSLVTQSRFQSNWANAQMRLFSTSATHKQLCLLFSVVVLIICFFIPTTYLPSNGYVMAPFIIQRTARIIPSKDTLTAILTVPELPNAIFRTKGIKINDFLWLKLYPGNVMFYGYLITLLLLIGVLRLTQKGRYWLNRRVPRFPSWSMCEATCLVLTVILVFFFGVYWIHDHNYKAYWHKDAAPEDVMWRTEAWARGFGQIAVLLLSLLLFPISRHSVLFKLLGTSYDSMMWLHRLLGYAMLLVTLAHIVFYYIVFYKQGVLLHNLNKLPTVIIGKRTFGSDWSVQLITWTTWMMFMSMGLFALNRIRRRCYELFYYSHLVASYALLPAVLWHAASSWECMLPGLTLWFVDQLIRLFHNTSLVNIKRARVVSDNVVEIAFEVESVKFTDYYPGHYVFVNIPEISPLQWHPFTISSCINSCSDNNNGFSETSLQSLSASSQSLLTVQQSNNYSAKQETTNIISNSNDGSRDEIVKSSNIKSNKNAENNKNTILHLPGTVRATDSESESLSEHSPLHDEEQRCINLKEHSAMTLHIKRLGPKSWTGQLYERILHQQPFTMSVKGPCGTPIDYHHYRDIFLVCGGIGVAPCSSIFGSLLREHVEHFNRTNTVSRQRVYLLWMTRSAGLIGAMSKILGLPRAYESFMYQDENNINNNNINNNINDANINDQMRSSNAAGEEQYIATTNDVFDNDGDNVVETKNEYDNSNDDDDAQNVTIEAQPVNDSSCIVRSTTKNSALTRTCASKTNGKLLSGNNRNVENARTLTNEVHPVYNHFSCQIFVTEQQNYALLKEQGLCGSNNNSTYVHCQQECNENESINNSNNNINNNNNNNNTYSHKSCLLSSQAKNTLVNHDNTANATGNERLFPVHINCGRANIVNEITAHIEHVSLDPSLGYKREKALIFACGPSLLVHEAVKVAAKHKISFHEEVFEL